MERGYAIGSILFARIKDRKIIILKFSILYLTYCLMSREAFQGMFILFSFFVACIQYCFV